MAVQMTAGRWVGGGAVVVGALLGAAALATGYGWSSKLWLLTGCLLAVGMIGTATYYTVTARGRFAAESAAGRMRRGELADQYARIAEGRLAASDAEARGDGAAAGARVQGLADAAGALERAMVLAQDAAPDDRGVVAATMVMNIVVFVVSGFVVVSFCTAGDRASWAGGILWAAACLLLGGTAGFLFGIPRFRSEGKTPQTAPQTPKPVAGMVARDAGAGAPARPVTATNDQSPIEQIADWLTKTIVGVALVNLKALPGKLHGWAEAVAGSLGNGGATTWSAGGVAIRAQSFALGLILYFTILGFLSGYLLTQFFLQRYVNRHGGQ